MKKLIVVLIAAATLLLSGCASMNLKAPMEGIPQGTVDVLSPDGTLTTIDTLSYARKLQADVIQDCLAYHKEQIMLGYKAIGELEDSTERLVAVVSNQWKEAMISINGEEQCQEGTNEWDAYIAYAESQGKIYEVLVSEIGKTVRFGVGSLAAGWAIDTIADSMGNKIGGDQVIAGHNATKAEDFGSASASSTETFTETHSTQTNTLVGSDESAIIQPSTSNTPGISGPVDPTLVTEPALPEGEELVEGLITEEPIIQ